MKLEIDQQDVKFIVSNEPYFEFEYLQAVAKRTNTKTAIKDRRDEFYVSAIIDEEPAYSCTAVNGGLYDNNVLRVSTKFFANPKFAKKTPKKLFQKICQYGTEIFKNYDVEIPEFKRFNFFFISRHPNSNPIKRLYKDIGWEVEDPHLYLVGKDPAKSTAWRYIYYSGDIKNFNVPRMTVEQYKEKFGRYIFNKDWSDSAIANTQHLLKDRTVNNILEIGTFEGAYTLFLAEHYKTNIHTIDPFNSDVYGLDQVIFDEVESNWNNNLKESGYKNIIHYKDYSNNVLKKLLLNGIRFDFVYVDGDHTASVVLEDLKLSYKLLNENGIILVDDAVNWQARDHVTNQIINDITLTPKYALDQFLNMGYQVQLLTLPKQNQVALMKI